MESAMIDRIRNWAADQLERLARALRGGGPGEENRGGGPGEEK
jgi:hypothetical protein